VQPDYGLIMSVVVGRRSFIEENPETVAILLEEYAASIAFMTGNLYEAAQLAAYYEIIPNAAIAEQALPRTHITFISGETMKRNLLGFYNVLYQAAPQSIGGRIPDENFFFLP
jgi:NitT/TauT family transport system substrate-binding protein